MAVALEAINLGSPSVHAFNQGLARNRGQSVHLSNLRSRVSLSLRSKPLRPPM